MDHEWAAHQLKEFLQIIEDYSCLLYYQSNPFGEDEVEKFDDLKERYGSAGDALDRLISRNSVMQGLMNAAQPGLGEYPEAPDAGWTYEGIAWWHEFVRPRALRAVGIHEFGEEAHRRMQPDSPDLVADPFHPWVWEAAAPLWHAGSKQEAVHAAARSVNARMQQKRGRHDRSDATLCREFFSLDNPAPDRPRLRFPGYNRGDMTLRSRQQGAIEFGAGCFEGIRNPAAHEHGLILSDQVALEQLAAFSLFARWVDECEVVTDLGIPSVLRAPGAHRRPRRSRSTTAAALLALVGSSPATPRPRNWTHPASAPGPTCSQCSAAGAGHPTRPTRGPCPLRAGARTCASPRPRRPGTAQHPRGGRGSGVARRHAGRGRVRRRGRKLRPRPPLHGHP
jgi:Protein of unknown function (Hypoth_ymh)